MNFHPTPSTNDSHAAVQECVEAQADSQTNNPKSFTAIQDLVECGNAKDIKHSQHTCHLGLKEILGRSK